MKKTLTGMIIMIIMVMIMGAVNVSNAFSFNANLSSNDKLVAGQEVKVTLSLSDIDMDDGIRSIKVGKITVGEEFEPVSSANFSSSTWMTTYSNGGLILMSGTPIKSDGVAVTLTLKLKSGVTAKSSTVKFENIVASSGSNTGDISAGSQTITIKANDTGTGDEDEDGKGDNGEGSSGSEDEKDENGEGNNGSEDEKGENGEGNSGSEAGNGDSKGGTTNLGTNNKQNETNKSTDKNTNNTTKTTSSQTVPSKLPKTGNIGNIIIISLILIVTVVGTVVFVKYKKSK